MQVYIFNVSGRAQVLLLLCLVDLLQVQNVVSSSRPKRQTCIGQYRCPDGSCVPTALDRCSSGCFYNEKKCPRSGRCIYLALTCSTSNPTVPCTFNTFKCPDGKCISNIYEKCSNGCYYFQKNCLDGLCKLSCTGVICNYKCPDGKCVSSSYSRCSNGYNYNRKKCPDGSCKYSYQSCTGVRCNYKCPDGKCVSLSSSRCSNGCPYNQKKCPDGFCIYSYKNCSSTCNFMCQDGKCFSSRYSLCSNGCPYDQKKCIDGTCRPIGSNCSTLVGLVALPVILILIMVGLFYLGVRSKKRSSPTMATNMTPVTARGPVFTTGPGVPVQPMHVNTAYSPDWQNGASNGYPAPSSPGVAALPPAYQDALNDGVYPTVQPQKSLDEGLPTYDSVAHIKPEEPSDTPSVASYSAQPHPDAAPQEENSRIYTIPNNTGNFSTSVRM